MAQVVAQAKLAHFRDWRKIREPRKFSSSDSDRQFAEINHRFLPAADC